MKLVYHIATERTDILQLTHDEYALIRQGLMELRSQTKSPDVKKEATDLFTKLSEAHGKATLTDD